MNRRTRLATVVAACMVLALLAGQFGSQWLYAQPVGSQPASQLAKGGYDSVRGYALALRAAEEQNVTDTTKRVGLEVFRETDSGRLVYTVSESGAVAVAQGPGNYEICQLGMPNGSRELIRFHCLTGESWRFNDNAWQPIPEDGAAGAGDYEVLMLVGAENRFWAMRYDRVSGRTWNLAEGKWYPMVEQQTPATTPQPQP